LIVNSGKYAGCVTKSISINFNFKTLTTTFSKSLQWFVENSGGIQNFQYWSFMRYAQSLMDYHRSLMMKIANPAVGKQ